jgi:hypothetical protein
LILPIERKFDPPIVYFPLGLTAFLATENEVLTPNGSALDVIDDPKVGTDAILSHGKSFRHSRQFFGSKGTIIGDLPLASESNPFKPRAEGVGSGSGDIKPAVKVYAWYTNLLELLEFELAVEEAKENDSYPPNALTGGFDIRSRLVRKVDQNAQPLTPSQIRAFLSDRISSVRQNTPPLITLPLGWIFDEAIWDAVTRYAFLQYEFFYAYNDFDRYQTTPFENEHEGDNEGCCLVFDRNVINAVASSGELQRAVPLCIITSVHEELQDADKLKFIAPVDDPDPRQSIELIAYVAAGSHATYLTPGSHPLVDFGDAFAYIKENIEAFVLATMLIDAGTLLTLATLAIIVEHFVDTKDKTSDDGIRSGPEIIAEGLEVEVLNLLKMLPMSQDEHIYQNVPEMELLLKLRAFPGKWGGHNGHIDKSPQYTAKTGRYFRKLLSSL